MQSKDNNLKVTMFEKGELITAHISDGVTEIYKQIAPIYFERWLKATDSLTIGAAYLDNSTREDLPFSVDEYWELQTINDLSGKHHLLQYILYTPVLLAEVELELAEEQFKEVLDQQLVWAKRGGDTAACRDAVLAYYKTVDLSRQKLEIVRSIPVLSIANIINPAA